MRTEIALVDLRSRPPSPVQLSVEIPELGRDDCALALRIRRNGREQHVLYAASRFWRPACRVDDLREMLSILARRMPMERTLRPPSHNEQDVGRPRPLPPEDEDGVAFRALVAEDARHMGAVVYVAVNEPMLTLSIERNSFLDLMLPPLILGERQVESPHSTLFRIGGIAAAEDLRTRIRSRNLPNLPEIEVGNPAIFMDEDEEQRRFVDGTRAWLARDLATIRCGMAPLPILTAHRELFGAGKATLPRLVNYLEALGPPLRVDRRSTGAYGINGYHADTRAVRSATALASARIASQYRDGDGSEYAVDLADFEI